MQTVKKIYVGIDPGVHTGLAIWNKGEKKLELKTVKLHQAFDLVRQHKASIHTLVIENPNLWNYFTDHKTARARLQGAGSVKRDFKAWQDFLADEQIPFCAVRPDKKRNALATNKDHFTRITGYTGKSSEHARVAAMLIVGL
jgi:hypothetical protein